MNAELLRQAGKLYEDVIALPEHLRDTFLNEQCADNRELASVVRRLLLAGSHERDANRAALEGVSPVEPETEQMFGQYRAISVLGQGGMGTVYRAERADGQFVRQAAVKVVSGAIAGDDLRLRFLTERQILAHLDHPNIARLLDGGVTDRGEPFLVMEYVDGEPIDQWCDRHRLPLRDRIHLFLKVLAAVDFAHRQLIVHRDIKPQNVFVDQSGEPRLLDFGTAKILGPEQLSKTQQFLTPRYASPEQLRSEPASIGIDVYALGVLLYELLTGHWPFGDPADASLNLARAMGNVRPTLPTAHTSEAAAASRGVGLRQLRDSLRGDLSFILSRALEADPKTRYQTVRDFAEDLERYLSGHPVRARRQSLDYLLRRWVARHRWAAAAIVLIAISLAAGFLLREQQRRLAEQREVELRALSRYQLFELQDQMAFYGTNVVLRREAAQRSLDALDRVPAGRSVSAPLRAELAQSYARLAEILGNPLRANLGRDADARRALAKAKELVAGLPASDEFSEARISVLLQQAMFDYAASKGDAPLQQALKLINDIRNKVRPEQDPPETLNRIAAVLGTLVQVRRNAGGTILDETIGEAELNFALQLAETAIRRAPHLPHLQLTRFAILLSQADALAANNPDHGIAALVAIPAEIDKLPPTTASARALRFIKAQAFSAAGWFQGQAKRYDDAIASLSQAASLFERIASDDPGQINAYFDLAATYRTLGFVHEYAGHFEGAIEPLRKAIAGYDFLLSKSPDEGIRMVRAETLIRLAKDLQRTGAMAEARVAGDQGLETLVALASRPNATLNQLINGARYLLDPPLVEQKDAARAVAFAKRAVEQAPGSVFTQEILSLAAEQSGDLTLAVQAARKRFDLTPATNAPARQVALDRLRQVEKRLASSAGLNPQ